MSLPQEYRKVVVHNMTTKFRDAIKIVTVPLQKPVKREVLVKIKYVGVNATDLNMTAGRYFVSGNPPYDIGLEALGEVVAVGEEVTKVKVGDAVTFFEIGSYAEYKIVHEDNAVLIPSAKPEFINILVSGLTAAIGLDKQAKIKKDDKVVITAAAGGLGQIAIQWCKAAGCHVIGLCSTKEKEDYIKALECDHVINYKTQNLSEVLEKEYPKGVDIVWETIGGEVYKTLVKSLAVRGKLVVVGYVTGYKDKGLPESEIPDLPQQLLLKSASVNGFLLFHYKEYFEEYLKKLISSIESGNLKTRLDRGENTSGGEFNELEGIIPAVEHLHSSKSFGKVIVKIY